MNAVNDGHTKKGAPCPRNVTCPAPAPTALPLALALALPLALPLPPPCHPPACRGPQAERRYSLPMSRLSPMHQTLTVSTPQSGYNRHSCLTGERHHLGGLTDSPTHTVTTTPASGTLLDCGPIPVFLLVPIPRKILQVPGVYLCAFTCVSNVCPPVFRHHTMRQTQLKVLSKLQSSEQAKIYPGVAYLS